MGEEDKKPAEEEKKMEEKKEEEKEKKPEAKKEEKTEGGGGDGKKGDDSKEETPLPPPPPPQEVVLKVYMHCEGCARKVRKSLLGFEGVEDVITDCKSSKVVVKGEKAAADPLKVLHRLQRKSHRQVQLISPIPKPPSEEEKKAAEEEKPKPEAKKEEPPQIITVVLKVFMHCEACAMKIKKCIQRMEGVESAEPDLKSSEVTVKGVFEAQKLVEYVYKRSGKQAVILKQEPEKKAEGGDQEADKEKKDEKKAEGGEKQEKRSEGDNKEEKKGGVEERKGGEETEDTIEVELKRNQYYHNNYPPRYAMEEMYPYPPQIFSDENPNACSVM